MITASDTPYMFLKRCPDCDELFALEFDKPGFACADCQPEAGFVEVETSVFPPLDQFFT